MSPCWGWCGSASGLVAMAGKGDTFFPRVFFVGKISGALSVPKSKCLVTLRYFPRADLALGEVGGGSGKGKPEAKTMSWHSHPPPACIALDFSFGKRVVPVPFAGLERAFMGQRAMPQGSPGLIWGFISH